MFKFILLPDNYLNVLEIKPSKLTATSIAVYKINTFEDTITSIRHVIGSDRFLEHLQGLIDKHISEIKPFCTVLGLLCN